MKLWSTSYMRKPKWAFDKVAPLIDRMRFMKEVRLENISPALAIMYLEKSEMVSELAGGFAESIIRAENDDRKQIFIDYYNQNKNDVKDKLKEQCLKNVKFVNDVINTSLIDIAPVMIEEPVAVLLDSLKREEIRDIHDLNNQLDILELVVRNIYLEKIESPVRSAGHIAPNRSISFDEFRAILDKATRNLPLDPKQDINKIDNTWITTQAKLLLITLYVFAPTGIYRWRLGGNDENWYKSNDPDGFNNFITNIPSKTPEGMISIWDNRVYPTLLTDFYSSSMLDVNMVQYLECIWMDTTHQQQENDDSVEVIEN